jgi:hypothetical protein
MTKRKEFLEVKFYRDEGVLRILDFENSTEDMGSINIDAAYLISLERSEACRFIGERIVGSIP